MRNLFKWQTWLIMSFFMCFLVLGACSNDDPSDEADANRSEYADSADATDEDLSDYLDSVPAEEVSDEDFVLENGANAIETIEAYDSEFVQENPWIYEFNQDEIGKSHMDTRGGSAVTGNAGIINLKNTVISQLLLGCRFFLNDQNGKSINSVVAKTISAHDQEGLWYKWGGKIWDQYSYPSADGKPVDGKEVMCYGLDCSGFVYSAAQKIGLKVPIRNAASYYDTNVWNTALSSFIKNKSQFSEEIKDNLKFEKYTYSSKELVSKVQPGDILFWGISNQGHIGIVTSGSKIAQSNGQRHPETASHNYYHPTKKQYRGPHLITVNNAALYWGVSQFGVIRLVASMNNTHWRLKIKCEGHDTYITTFDIEIKLSETESGDITIDPVTTIGYDYNGEPCDVYFEGKYNIETQVLKGSVRKTYSADDTRTDGFEVKLTDDNIFNITEFKIVSNGGCTNVLDLENLDNISEPSTGRSSQSSVEVLKGKMNTANSRAKEGECKDGAVIYYNPYYFGEK